MVTSNATKQQTVAVVADAKMVQVAEAYSYLSDQKEINLDSIPLPLSPPPLPLPPSSSTKQDEQSSANSTRPQTPASTLSCSYNFNILDTVDSFEVLEQTIIKQKRLARFKNTDLRRKILLKRTFDLVCEIMDHENGFDFEDETETINKKQDTAAAASKKSRVEDEDEDDDDDSSSSSSDSDSDSSSDEEDDDDSSSSSSGSSDDESEEEEDEEQEEERESIKRPIKQQLVEIDQLIPKPSESMKSSSLKVKLVAWSSDDDFARTHLTDPASLEESNESSKFSQTNSDSARTSLLIGHQEPVAEFSVVIHNHPPSSNEDLDFTELNSIDISESYDDSAFNLDQVTTYVDEQPANTQLYELKTFQDTAECDLTSSATTISNTTSILKRKRNSFEETVHQNEQDLFGTTTSLCCSSDLPNNDQQLFYANPSLASLSDSTCFYNNQPSPVKSVKRPLTDDADADDLVEVKRLKSN